MYQPVAHRTRSKKFSVVVDGKSTMYRKRKTVDEDDDEVIFLGERADKVESFDDDGVIFLGERADKVESFDDDGVIFLGERADKVESFDDDEYMESEDVETSDDDFKVDENDDDVKSEYSSSEESDYSGDNERRGYKMSKERGRKVVSESESSRVLRRKGDSAKDVSNEEPLTDATGPKSPVKEGQEGTTFPVATTASQDKNTSQKNMPRSSTSKARNMCATLDAEQAIKEKLNISVASVKDTCTSAIPVQDKESTFPTTDVIVLIDDEQEPNAGDISRARQVEENPDIPIWHCVSSYGVTGGPFSMAALKLWAETSTTTSRFKVWKTSQSAAEAMPLTDALKRIFKGNK